MDALVEGTLNNQAISGSGYMEKTYGTNFPNRWIWLQSNHSENGSTITFSVGMVPVLFFRIKGFLLIYHYNGEEVRLGSFNLSTLKIMESTDTSTKFIVKKGYHLVIIEATTVHPVKLLGPRKNGIMDLPVYESIEATAHIKAFYKGALVLEDTYTHVGLDLM